MKQGRGGGVQSPMTFEKGGQKEQGGGKEAYDLSLLKEEGVKVAPSLYDLI